MSLRRLSLRPIAFVLVCSAALLFIADNARGEKVPKPDGKPADGKPTVNRTAEVFWGSSWYPVQVLDEKDGKFYVHYDTYTDASNEWVTKDRVRFPTKVKEGSRKAEVEWAGTWYPAQILEEMEGKFHIKYDGYGEEWNEWVGKERVRFAEKPKKVVKPAADAKVAKQTKCEVLWSTTWYPAQVLEVKDGKFHIKYDNYGDNWNEWVGKDRIRFTDKPVAPKELGKPEVEWNGTWYPAQVLETKDGKYYIKYDNYGDNWNEWVGKDRIRLLNSDKPAAKPGSEPKKY